MNAPRALLSVMDREVAYLTDVEGSWQRLSTFCDHNPVLRLDPDGRLHVAPGALFVFGGDAIDRGPWSRRVIRTLLDVKERQPEQVVLLCGNRDLNKLRLVTELAGRPPRKAPDDVRALPRAALLKWIFIHTMGAADAFEHRRTELKAEGAPHDDESVAQSYLDDLAPSGMLTRYLTHCQLALRVGVTLFVHGGVAPEALAVVPGHTPTALQAFELERWLHQLDAFYRQQLDAFRQRAFEPDGTPCWESAILYQAPRRGMRLNPGSVVYGRMGDAHNNPALPDAEVIATLTRCGVHRVVVGHTPTGDTPSMVRTTTGPLFEVVNADNSRSRVHTASRLILDDARVRLDAQVVLDGGEERAVRFELASADRASPIGLRTADGSLVKAQLDDGWLVFRYLPAFELTQRVVAELGPLAPAIMAAGEDPC